MLARKFYIYIYILKVCQTSPTAQSHHHGILHPSGSRRCGHPDQETMSPLRPTLHLCLLQSILYSHRKTLSVEQREGSLDDPLPNDGPTWPKPDTDSMTPPDEERDTLFERISLKSIDRDAHHTRLHRVVHRNVPYRRVD